MTRRTALWLAAVPFLALASLGHWIYWYQPRLRPATPEGDLPAKIFAEASFDTAVWIAHPHQNLPALGNLTGLGGPSLEAALRLAGVDAPPLESVRLPPASSLAVGASADGEHWLAAAKIHPLAAGFLRLAGALADNPWLGGGTLRWTGGGRPADLHIGWSGTTWRATTDPAALERVDAAPAAHSAAARSAPAVAWVRLPPGDSGGDGGGGGARDPLWPQGPVALMAETKPMPRVRLATTTRSPGALPQTGRAGGTEPATDRDTGESGERLRLGRRVLETGEALLLVMQGAKGDLRAPDRVALDQALLLFPLPVGTDPGELPRSAVVFRAPESALTAPGSPSAPPSKPGSPWKLPGEQLLELGGHDLPRGRADGWSVRATDAVALGQALAAVRSLRVLWDADGRAPRWGLWLDVEPAATEIERLARGLEHSPLLRRDDQRRWHDAAIVLRALARPGARVEAVSLEEEMVLLWTAQAAADAGPVSPSP